MSMFDRCSEFARTVDQVKARSHYFYLREFEPTATPIVKLNGREMIMLGSNNYLGLANHPRVKAAAIAALERYGTGACSSRILTGTSELHSELERRLARFKGAEDAVLFSTGFMTMSGTVAALTGPGDVILSDELNHASIVDGCRISRAERRIYRHNDMASLEEELTRSADAANRLIVTDGVFSMRGTIANLPEIRRLADQYHAAVMVDDAHGSGVMGEHGRGIAEHFGLEGRIELACGTFSKTFATVGGFTCASRDVVTFLKHNSRPFVFTASLPPVVVATVLAGLDVLDREPELLQNLHRNAAFVKRELTALGFRLEPTVTPIIPILVGRDETAFMMAGRLQDEGIVVNPIVPPAVAADNCLIRVSLMATFTIEQLAEAITRFKKVGQQLKLI